MASHTNPDKIIEEIGGCGRFQIMVSVVSHVIKVVMCFSFSSMIIFAFTPPWWCNDDVTMSNQTSCAGFQNNTEVIFCPQQTCSVNGSKCSSFEFSGQMRTLVSEFHLVCDRDYIPSLIMSLQLVGMLVGNLVAGHIAEYIGRKKPFFAAIAMLIVANIIGYFNTNWIVFLVSRVIVGIAGAFFMTTTQSLLSEFSSAKWRTWIIGFPSWSLESIVFAVLAWLIQDWRNIQLMIAIVGIPCLLPWFIIPESFRWYIAHDRLDEAKQIIEKVASINKHEVGGLESLMTQPSNKVESKKYTLVDLFRTRKLARISILSSFNWLLLGMGTYGISFGIQALSGNVFLNFSLFNIVAIPSQLIAMWLSNKVGRRKTTVVCFVLVAIGGFAVAIIESVDPPNKGSLMNAFALLANSGVITAWGPVQTMTLEQYPTVIRPIGFGTLSVIARIGATLGPQLVYLNLRTPGLMYYIIGGLAVICVVGCFGLPETKDANLTDKLDRKHRHTHDRNEDKTSIL